MKEKKDVKIDFRTSKSVKQEARSYPYTYEEIFIMGLGCVRDKDVYKFIKLNELEQDVKDLQCRLDDYDVLKHKLSVKEEELQNKRKELDVGDKVDVIEYNRNKKLNVVVSGLLDRYYSFGASAEDFIKKNNLMFQESAANNNLDMNLVVEKIHIKKCPDSHDKKCPDSHDKNFC